MADKVAYCLKRRRLIMKRLSWFVISVLILAMVVGCGKKDEGVIKIGAILPLTGSAAPYGQNAKNGIHSSLFNGSRMIIILTRSVAIIAFKPS